MKLTTAAQFEVVLRLGRLEMSAPSMGIGRQLSYATNPAHVLVVHFVDRDPTTYRCGVTERILDAAKSWLLFPRYGALPNFGLREVNAATAAVEFGIEERRSLAEYLTTRPMEFGKPGLDLYAVAPDGQILVTWDHHTKTKD